MSKKIRSASDKIAIVMESFTTNIGAAELCRKHNFSPRVFYSWKEKFLESGKQALSARKGKSPSTILQKENADLKTLIGEMAFANSVLKKPWREAKDECSTGNENADITNKVQTLCRNIQNHVVL